MALIATTGCILKTASLVILLFLVGVSNGFLAAEDISDETEYRKVSTAAPETLESYEHALQTWKTPEDINAWIASSFSYDT